MFRSGQVRSGQAGLGQVRPSWAGAGQVRPFFLICNPLNNGKLWLAPGAHPSRKDVTGVTFLCHESLSLHKLF